MRLRPPRSGQGPALFQAGSDQLPERPDLHGAALQRRILSIFQYALKAGGFLFLGNSESISDYSEAFTAEDRKHRIFSPKPVMADFHELTHSWIAFQNWRPTAEG